MKTLKSTLPLITFITATSLSYGQMIDLYDAAINAPLQSGNSAENGVQTPDQDLGLGTTPGANDLEELLALDTGAAIYENSEYTVFGGFRSGVDATYGTGFGGTQAIIFRNEGVIRVQTSPIDKDVEELGGDPAGAFGFMNALVYLENPNLVDLPGQTLELQTDTFAANLTGAMHMVVKSGSDFYLSSETFSTELDTWSLDASATDWFAWDFVNNGFDVTPIAGVPAPSVAVDGVGFYSSFNNSTDEFADVIVNVSRISATAVPEPSFFAGFLGMTALFLVARRRHR